MYLMPHTESRTCCTYTHVHTHTPRYNVKGEIEMTVDHTILLLCKLVDMARNNWSGPKQPHINGTCHGIMYGTSVT